MFVATEYTAEVRMIDLKPPGGRNENDTVPFAVFRTLRNRLPAFTRSDEACVTSRFVNIPPIHPSDADGVTARSSVVVSVALDASPNVACSMTDSDSR